MTRKIAVVGSGTFPLTCEVGAQVVDVIRGYEDAVFITRGSGPFEKFVGHVCLTLGVRCFEMKGGGGGDNFVRDAELVMACDELVAFIDPAVLDKPHGGTQMVIERALSAGRKVRAATAVEGNLVWEEA